MSNIFVFDTITKTVLHMHPTDAAHAKRVDPRYRTHDIPVDAPMAVNQADWQSRKVLTPEGKVVIEGEERPGAAQAEDERVADQEAREKAAQEKFDADHQAELDRRIEYDKRFANQPMTNDEFHRRQVWDEAHPQPAKGDAQGAVHE